MKTMSAAAKPLYHTDFVEWTADTAELLRQGRVAEADLEHIADEIEDLGKRDRRAVKSQLLRLLKHQIKRTIQPDRGCASWRESITTSRDAIMDILADSPSLRRFPERDLTEVYRRAAAEARFETGLDSAALPEDCPHSLDELLERQSF